MFADSLSMSDLDTPKRLRVSKFDEIDCPSPYQDANHLHRRSLQFEKRAVLLVQELLSLTLEKRVLVDHLTHFRKEFNFSKKVCFVFLIRVSLRCLCLKVSELASTVESMPSVIMTSETSSAFIICTKAVMVQFNLW